MLIWRVCTATVVIPAARFLKLVADHVDQETGEVDYRPLHFWLLSQMLLIDGQHGGIL